MKNQFNTILTGPLYFGSNRYLLNVSYETGVTSTMAVVKGCEYHCLGKFDPAQSSTFSSVSESTTSIFFTDGHNVRVTKVKDSVCLGYDAATCVNDYTWLAIQYATDFDWIDGLLGLASRNSIFAENVSSTTSYIDELKKAGIITERRASFYVPTYGLPIHTDFGPID